MNRKIVFLMLTAIPVLALQSTVVAKEKNSKIVAVSSGTKSKTQQDKSQSYSKNQVPLKTARPIFNKNFLRPQPIIYKYNEPADLIELIPVVRDINRWIPKRFSIADHDVRLISNEIIIQHHYHDIRSRTTQKNSIITLSYFGDMGSQFGTRLDVPLFYSSVLGFSDWSRYPFGNYTMTFTGNNFSLEDRLYIRAQSRF